MMIVFHPSDINECWRYPGRLCAQTCENTPGSYKCSCTSGFRLSADGKSCEGVFLLMSVRLGCMHVAACCFFSRFVCENVHAWTTSSCTFTNNVA